MSKCSPSFYLVVLSVLGIFTGQGMMVMGTGLTQVQGSYLLAGGFILGVSILLFLEIRNRHLDPSDPDRPISSIVSGFATMFTDPW